MDFEFNISKGLGFDVDIGGSAPAPPAPEVSGTPYGVPVVQISMYAPEETPYGVVTMLEEE